MGEQGERAKREQSTGQSTLNKKSERESDQRVRSHLGREGQAGQDNLSRERIAGSMRLAMNHLKPKRAIRQARTIKSTRIERESENRERREYLD